MAEWVKTLITALSGLLVGLLAEPFKNQIQFYMNGYRAKKALQEDLDDRVDDIIFSYQRQLPNRLRRHMTRERETYDYYASHYPEQFYTYEPLRTFQFLYNFVGPHRQEYLEKLDTEELRSTVQEFLEWVRRNESHVARKTIVNIRDSGILPPSGLDIHFVPVPLTDDPPDLANPHP